MSKAYPIKLPDAAARRQIETSLDRNVLVEAAAGTGKTTLMVKRILNLVGDKTLEQRLSKIAAITFTEKAAGELKMKLREQLEHAGFPAKVLAELELAQCGTIHSFCAGILHERPVEAGVDPAFQVADPLQTELLQEEVWRDWIEEQMAAESGADVLTRALYLDIELPTLRNLAQELVGQRARLSWANLSSCRAIGEILREVGPIIAALVKLAPSCTDAENDTMMKRIAPLIAAAPVWGALTAREQEHVLLRVVVAAPKSGNFNRIGFKKNWPTERLLLDARKCMARLADLCDEAGNTFVRELLLWLRGFGDTYASEKQRRGLLDFDDLLLKTRDLLRDNHDVRRDFQRRYDRLLVDEFQDTDPVQTEIVFFLAEKAPATDDWRKVKLAPGKLFVVGDPKQSIYRFRGADIEVYHAAKEALAAQGNIEKITTSFRTASPLIDWVNDVFARLIQPPTVGAVYQPGYVALHAHPQLQHQEPRVLLLGPTPQETAELGEKPSVDALRRVEAKAVAQLLLHLHGNTGREVTYCDEAGTLRRRVPVWSDFAVLLRSYTALDLYERVFEAFDIPFLVEGGKDYFQRPEVRAVCALLLALDNPANKVELVSVLRSPIFGVSDDDLVAWTRIENRPLDYLSDKLGNDGTIATAFRLLRELNAERNRYSYAAFLERCCERLKIPERFLLRPQGEQRVANLYKLVDTARAVQSIEGISLRGLARHLRDIAIERAEEGQSPTTEPEKGRDDSVRILTVHKAKGLEWGIVILADMVREGRGGRDMVLPDPDTRRPEAQLSGLASAGFEAAQEEDRKRQDAEERRLLYVACTRARDWFVLPWMSKRGEYARILAEVFDPQTGGGVERVDRAKIAASATRPPPPQIGLGEPDERQQRAVAKLVAARNEWIAARKSSEAAWFAGVKKLTPSSLGEREHLRETAKTTSAGGGIEIGRRVHEALSRCNLRDVEEAAKLFPQGEKFIRTALTHDLIKRALAADELHREVPVVWQSPDGLMEGYIDLLFREGERLVVVDYKTDAKPEPKLYAAQLTAYADALKAITGKPVAEKLLFFLVSGEVVAV
jgi:ATP-dependent exoDNAse (exonuclease V) beta subunit